MPDVEESLYYLNSPIISSGVLEKKQVDVEWEWEWEIERRLFNEMVVVGDVGSVEEKQRNKVSFFHITSTVQVCSTEFMQFM